jgi:predicted small secreted protein
MHRPSAHRAITIVSVLLSAIVLVASATSLSGCNIVGGVATIVHGPPKIAAAYKLPKDRPTVILIDDRANVLPRRVLRQTIALRAEKELLSSGVLTKVIDSNAIQAALARDNPDQPTDIATLVKSVQAEVVIYVALDKFDISPDGQMYQPFANARIKVMDVSEGSKRLWPEQREGSSLNIILPTTRGDLPTGAAGLALAQERLASELGLAISQLFYKHVRETTLDKATR